MQITDIMTRNPATAAADDSLQSVAQAMENGNFGSLPVVDGDRLIGVVTDRDIAIRGVAAGRAPDSAVREIITPDPVCVGTDCSVADAARLMQERQIRRLYVKDGETLAGVVSLGDVALQAGENLSGQTLESISQG